MEHRLLHRLPLRLADNEPFGWPDKRADHSQPVAWPDGGAHGSAHERPDGGPHHEPIGRPDVEPHCHVIYDAEHLKPICAADGCAVADPGQLRAALVALARRQILWWCSSSPCLCGG